MIGRSDSKDETNCSIDSGLEPATTRSTGIARSADQTAPSSTSEKQVQLPSPTFGSADDDEPPQLVASAPPNLKLTETSIDPTPSVGLPRPAPEQGPAGSGPNPETRERPREFGVTGKPKSQCKLFMPKRKKAQPTRTSTAYNQPSTYARSHHAQGNKLQPAQVSAPDCSDSRKEEPDPSLDWGTTREEIDQQPLGRSNQDLTVDPSRADEDELPHQDQAGVEGTRLEELTRFPRLDRNLLEVIIRTVIVQIKLIESRRNHEETVEILNNFKSHVVGLHPKHLTIFKDKLTDAVDRIKTIEFEIQRITGTIEDDLRSKIQASVQNHRHILSSPTIHPDGLFLDQWKPKPVEYLDHPSGSTAPLSNPAGLNPHINPDRLTIMLDSNPNSNSIPPSPPIEPFIAKDVSTTLECPWGSEEAIDQASSTSNVQSTDQAVVECPWGNHDSTSAPSSQPESTTTADANAFGWNDNTSSSKNVEGQYPSQHQKAWTMTGGAGPDDHQAPSAWSSFDNQNDRSNFTALHHQQPRGRGQGWAGRGNRPGRGGGGFNNYPSWSDHQQTDGFSDLSSTNPFEFGSGARGGGWGGFRGRRRGFGVGDGDRPRGGFGERGRGYGGGDRARGGSFGGRGRGFGGGGYGFNSHDENGFNNYDSSNGRSFQANGNPTGAGGWDQGAAAGWDQVAAGWGGAPTTTGSSKDGCKAGPPTGGGGWESLTEGSPASKRTVINYDSIASEVQPNQGQAWGGWNSSGSDAQTVGQVQSTATMTTTTDADQIMNPPTKIRPDDGDGKSRQIFFGVEGASGEPDPSLKFDDDQEARPKFHDWDRAGDGGSSTAEDPSIQVLDYEGHRGGGDSRDQGSSMAVDERPKDHSIECSKPSDPLNTGSGASKDLDPSDADRRSQPSQSVDAWAGCPW